MKRRWLIILGISVALMGIAQERGGDPFTPRVTKAQADRIQEATERSADSPEKALLWLAENRGESAAEAFTLGNLYYQTGDYPKAATEYRLAIVQFPGFRDARENLGRVLLTQEKTQEALEMFQGLIADGIADAEVYLLTGHSYMMEDHPVSAESAYRQALLLDQKQNEARVGLIQSSMAQGRYADARAWSSEYLKADPTHAGVWASKANAELGLGENREALQTLELAHRLKVAGVEMTLTLAELYLSEGLFEQAAVKISTIIGESDDIPRMVGIARGFLGAGEVKQAKRIHGQLTKRIGSSGAAVKEHRTLMEELGVEIAVEEGNPETIQLLTDKLLKHDPLNGKALLAKAEVYRRQGNRDLASIQYERAGRIRDVQAEAWRRYAEMKLESGDMEGAIELLERLVAQEEGERYQKQLERLKNLQK